MRRGIPWAVGILGACVLLGFILSRFAEETPGGPEAGLAGALLAGLAGAASFLWALHAREVRNRAFIAAVFGGMLLRLLGYGAALVAVRLTSSWSLGWFVGGVLGAHFTGQIIEIVGLVRVPPSASAAGEAGIDERTGGGS